MSLNKTRLAPRSVLTLVVLLFPLLAGCAGHRAEVRGRMPTGPTTAVARLAAAPANGTVTVRGTMVEK